MKFRSVIELSGKTATGFQVPAEVVERLGAGKRPAVHVTIKGHTYRSTVAPYGGVFMLPLSAENRAAAGVAAGDEVEVELAIDDRPREVQLPPDFSQALADEPQARQFFDGLSFSNQRWYAEWIGQAKQAETRQRRVAKALELLREGKARG